MLRKILIGVVAVIAVLAIVIAVQPADFKVERHGKIAASPAIVFAQVVDFHQWVAWSPWEKMDAATEKTFSGPEAGVGSVYAWKSKVTGQGRMTMTDAKPGERIDITLEFFEPYTATNQVVFAFAAEGDGGTTLTWSMSGTKNFMMKAFCMFGDMDTMVGKDFEDGIAGLSQVSEAKQKAAAADAAAAVAQPAQAEVAPAAEAPKP